MNIALIIHNFHLAVTKDLLGDDDDAGATSPPIHDHSAEIGNVQNQLDSTKRSLETTKAERTSIEATIANQAAQLSALQTQLSSAKAAYETETRLLAALRERYTNQTTDINKAREELIHAESDLSAVRVEKSEIEQHLLRDKEEVRDLQRKMTEAGSTIEHVKAEIEKAKKDAKQQKGLLAIAKKQLATRETERNRTVFNMNTVHECFNLQMKTNHRLGSLVWNRAVLAHQEDLCLDFDLTTRVSCHPRRVCS